MINFADLQNPWKAASLASHPAKAERSCTQKGERLILLANVLFDKAILGSGSQFIFPSEWQGLGNHKWKPFSQLCIFIKVIRNSVR
jgi:hypothetical protein